MSLRADLDPQVRLAAGRALEPFAALAIAERGDVMEVGRITLPGPAQDLIADNGVRQAYLGI